MDIVIISVIVQLLQIFFTCLQKHMTSHNKPAKCLEKEL